MQNALIVYRIQLANGRYLSNEGALAAPQTTAEPRLAASWPTYSDCATARTALAQYVERAGLGAMAPVLRDSQIVEQEIPHAEGGAAWDACVHLRETAARFVQIIAAGWPAYLMKPMREGAAR